MFIKFSIGNLITRRGDKGYVELPIEIFNQVISLTPFLSYNILQKIGELSPKETQNQILFMLLLKNILFMNIPKFEDYSKKYMNIAKIINAATDKRMANAVVLAEALMFSFIFIFYRVNLWQHPRIKKCNKD
jgi:hypothetical protein